MTAGDTLVYLDMVSGIVEGLVVELYNFLEMILDLVENLEVRECFAVYRDDSRELYLSQKALLPDHIHDYWLVEMP